MSAFKLMMVGSTAWGALSVAVPVLRELHEGKFRGATLLHRDTPGLEGAAGRWWRNWGGQTQAVASHEAGIRACDGAIAFCYDRCPQVMAALRLSDDLGVPVMVRSEGRPAWWPEEDAAGLRLVPRVQGSVYRRRAA